MGQPLLNSASMIECAHKGQVKHVLTVKAVLIDGQPAVVQLAPSPVSGCTLPPPPAGIGPCVIAAWSSGATKVTIQGFPALLKSSAATCVPTGAPVQIGQVQSKVEGI